MGISLRVLQALLALGIVVLVPIALRVAQHGMPVPSALRFARRLHPVAAVGAILAITLPSGPIATAAGLPWLVFTGAVGVGGAQGLLRGPKNLAAIGTNLAYCYLVVCGIWVPIYASGAQPLDLDSITILLAPIHYLFAAFILPIVGAQLVADRPTAVSRVVYVIALAANPLITIGIAFSPTVELIGVVGLTAAGIGVAVLQLGVAARRSSPAIKAGLSISSISLLFAMVLALSYAMQLPSELAPTRTTMIALHGVANGLGFGLVGLWSWNRIANQPNEGSAL